MVAKRNGGAGDEDGAAQVVGDHLLACDLVLLDEHLERGHAVEEDSVLAKVELHDPHQLGELAAEGLWVVLVGEPTVGLEAVVARYLSHHAKRSALCVHRQLIVQSCRHLRLLLGVTGSLQHILPVFDTAHALHQRGRDVAHEGLELEIPIVESHPLVPEEDVGLALVTQPSVRLAATTLAKSAKLCFL